MTSPAPPRLMTADEFFQLPDDGRQYELVEGRLVEVSASGGRASELGFKMGVEVWLHVRTNDLGTVCGEACGFRLFREPDTVRAPDFAFVRKGRLPYGRMPRGYFDGAPDLAVEVISPSNTWSEMWRKVDEYRQAGSGLIWVVDPDRRQTTVVAPNGSSVTVTFDEALDGRDVLPGFALNIAALGF